MVRALGQVSAVIPEAAQRLSGIHNHDSHDMGRPVVMDSGLRPSVVPGMTTIHSVRRDFAITSPEDRKARGRRSMRSWIAAGLAALVLALPTSAIAQKPEVTKVRLAVGGKSSLYYLPLTITERLGYFKEAGLDVEISDFAGGAKSLQALIGGS